MSDYYDRDGNPMEFFEWMIRFGDKEGCRVARTTIGDYLISTVWLGLNHNFGSGPPLIFETMIFDESGDADELPLSGDQWRYATEEQARRGHVEVCELVRAEIELAKP